MKKRVYLFLFGILFIPYFSSGTAQVYESCPNGCRIINYSMTLTPIFLDSSQDKYLQFRFFDSDNNETIPHVSFFLNVTKDDQKLMYDFFHTHSGIAKLKFEQGGAIGNWTVKGEKEPILNGWVNDTGLITVRSPIFVENGLYHLHVEMLGANSDNIIFSSSRSPKFDNDIIVGNSSENKIVNNSGSTMLAPLKQIANGILPENVKCSNGLVLIKRNTNSIACVKPQTAQKLVERRWGTTQISLTKENLETQSTLQNPVQFSAQIVPTNPKIGDRVGFDLTIQNKANYPIYYAVTCGAPQLYLSVTPADNIKMDPNIPCACLASPPVRQLNPNDTIDISGVYPSCFGWTGTISKLGDMVAKSTFLWGTTSQNPKTNVTSMLSTFNILANDSMNKTNSQSICENNGGKWDAKYRECVGVSIQTCETLNGAYNGCASSCRHIGPVNGEQPGCIGVCVQVCSVK